MFYAEEFEHQFSHKISEFKSVEEEYLRIYKVLIDLKLQKRKENHEKNCNNFNCFNDV